MEASVAEEEVEEEGTGSVAEDAQDKKVGEEDKNLEDEDGRS